jgi:transposase
MATERLDMIRVREILRQKLVDRRSHRAIAASLSVSPGTVGGACSRAKRLELTWEQVSGMSDADLDAMLFGVRGAAALARPEPDWSFVHTELRKKSVTLTLLHLEYLEEHADGLRFSAFCDRYATWRDRQKPTMRQCHVAGDKMFVDYAGQKVRLVDAHTGEVREVELFVAVLGASNLTFAEATETQTVPDFVGSCRRSFEFFGGVTSAIVPDQLKSAVVKSDRYEPEIQRTFHEFAEHYGAIVMPARPRHPRDKAKVEVAVQVVERWILARMRKETFYSLGEANVRISELLREINERFVMRTYKTTRRALFERIERSALRALPTEAFEVGTWKLLRVHFDYHVEIDHHFYSVSHLLAGAKLWGRFTPSTVEIFRDGERVTAHARSYVHGRHTTRDEHMPEAHRQHASWTPARLVSWAETNVGPIAGELCAVILENRRHPQQGFRSCLGIIRLAKRHEPARVEAACAKALAMRVYSSRFVENVLRHGLDRVDDAGGEALPPAVPQHENVRGPGYYH